MQYPPMILASASPRRKQILTNLEVNFRVILPSPPPDEDEIMNNYTTVEEKVMAVARAKALPVSQQYPTELVLGCDTVVVLNNRIYGKPADQTQAETMLRELSGHKHQVLSAIALIRQKDNLNLVDYIRTDVQFYNLTDEEIKRYIRLEQPFDKAGAYAAQSHGELIIHSIYGDFTNVVGLPVSLFRKMIEQINSK